MELMNALGAIEKAEKLCLVVKRTSSLPEAIGSCASRKRAIMVSHCIRPDEMCRVAKMRMPVVCAVISKASGMTTERAEDGIFSLRDSGCIIMLPENCQEVLDSIILTYSICEGKDVMIPGAVCIDNDTMLEPVQVPNDKTVAAFVPGLKATWLDHKNPAIITHGKDRESKFVQNESMKAAAKAMEKAHERWKEKVKRKYDMVEGYMTEDAETVIVTYGSMSTNARAAVDRMRANGQKVGMLRIRVFRPFPDVSKVLDGKAAVIVERNFAPGSGGIMWKELGRKDAGSYICDGTTADFEEAVKLLGKGELRGWSF